MGTSFSSDEEKMKDFNELSREEFLKSYSYLTKEDYDATWREVRRLTDERALELMEIELQCIEMADREECDRDCGKCDLLQNTSELKEAYNKVIWILSVRTKGITGILKYQAAKNLGKDLNRIRP